MVDETPGQEIATYVTGFYLIGLKYSVLVITSSMRHMAAWYSGVSPLSVVCRSVRSLPPTSGFFLKKNHLLLIHH